MRTRTDACDVLGVSPDASLDEVRIAYRQRMRALHPDRGRADDTATHEEIAAVSEAWRRLSNDSCGPFAWVPAGAPVERQHVRADAPRRASDVGPTPGLLRSVFAVAVILLLAWMAIFIVIAFSQSG